MFIVIYVFIFIGILALSYHLYRSIFRTNIIFSFIWLLFASIAHSGYYGINKTSFNVNYYVVIYCLFFNIIYFIVNKNNKIKKINVDYVPYFKISLICNIIALFISIPLLLKAIVLIKMYGFSNFRAFAFVKSDEFASTATLVIFQTIIQPLFTATYIFIASGYINNQKNNILNLVAIITIVSNTVMFAGRGSIYLLIIITLIYTVLKIEIYKKINIKYISFFILIITPFIYKIIAIRKFSSQSVFSTILLYFYGGFVFLDKKIENIMYGKSLTLGGVSYGFFYNFIYIPIRALGFNIAIPLYDYAAWAAEYIDIGGVRYNALGTVVLSNIYDFGSYFFILGFLPISMFISISDRLYYSNPKNLFYCSLRIYAVINAIRCVQTNPTANIDFIISILFLYIFTRKKRITNV